MSLAAPAAGPAAARPPRPRLRGLLHLIAFPVSLVAGAVLVAMAEPGAERWGCVVYALASAVLFGVRGLPPPPGLYTPFYVALGWVAVGVLPSLARAGGAGVVALIVVGGLAYNVGGVVYALRRPDPAPAVFGYHEVFHS